MMTGWKCYEEGERDVDELVAAAVEAIEGGDGPRYVYGPSSNDTRVFDHVGVSELELGHSCHGS